MSTPHTSHDNATTRIADDADASVTASLAAFVDSVTDALAAGAIPTELVEAVEADGERLITRVATETGEPASTTAATAASTADTNTSAAPTERTAPTDPPNTATATDVADTPAPTDSTDPTATPDAADAVATSEETDPTDATVAALTDRLETLKTDLHAEREARAKEAAEARQRIHELETQLEALPTADDPADPTAEPADDSPAPSTTPDATTQPTIQPPATPLEEVIRIPEHLVEDHLTANQRRARFVAADVAEYTRQVPAGRAIKAAALRRVLAAGEDARIYTETVSRVIEFLDELGDEAVTVEEAQDGQRVVVFTDGFVERVQQYHTARDAHRHSSNTVVTDEEPAE